ncbi:MAG: LuxR family transcriptional regulator [Alphaproteobacteria bacterium]|nr:LuxR family transcriptional regulator [Alphaproteobacteria bacterium]
MNNKKSIELLLSRLREEDSFLGLQQVFTEICHHYSLDQFFLGSYQYSKESMLDFEFFSSSYRIDWIERYTRKQYNLHDPRLKKLGKMSFPFSWDLTKKDKDLTPIQQRIFAEASDFAIQKGLTIPFLVKKDSLLILSVLNEKKIHPEALHALWFAAGIYVEKKKFFESKTIITGLTQREHQVLQLKSEGYYIKEVAEKLQVSEHTIVFHLRNIKEKLHAKSIDHTMYKFGAAL